MQMSRCGGPIGAQAAIDRDIHFPSCYLYFNFKAFLRYKLPIIHATFKLL